MAALLVSKVSWGDALRGIAIPPCAVDVGCSTTLVAILGTTISPYLFFWQASQEAEDQRGRHKQAAAGRETLRRAKEFCRIRADTIVGMAFSNLIALIITAAATLNATGKTDIQSSAQAAEALKPIAGIFAEFIFALGIIGTGLLAIPVLAGPPPTLSARAARWTVGLARKPREAVAFYSVLALSAASG